MCKLTELDYRVPRSVKRLLDGGDENDREEKSP